MILLKDFLELVGNDPTCLTLTKDEYQELKIQVMQERQKLQMKFDANPNKKTATALSNANNSVSPVDTCWYNSPEYISIKTTREKRNHEEMSGYLREIANGHRLTFC